MDQAQHGSVLVAQQKARAAVDFRRPTAVFQDALAAGGMRLRLLAMTNLIPLEGGVPLVMEGEVVDAIGVSGMQSAQDARVVIASAAALS
jgi:glc operon protein GlcG